MRGSTRAPWRHRTLWLSDIHLGSPACQADKVVQFLRQRECEQLFLVGDIFDGWRLRSRFYWTPDHSRVIKAILDKARRGTEVHYLTGNHDDFMRPFVHQSLDLGRIRVAQEVVHVTADGRRLLVLHGDSFDTVTTHHPWLALGGMAGYEALMRANKLLNQARGLLGQGPVPLSASVKQRVKTVVEWLSGFEEAVQHRCRQEGLDGIVCGHTHQAEIRHLRGGFVCYNAGDWVESCTALAESFEGHIELLNFEALRQDRRARRTARPVPELPHLPRHRIVVPPPAPAPEIAPRVQPSAPIAASEGAPGAPLH